VSTHDATKAWLSVQRSNCEVSGVTRLTNKHKSSVYRLDLRGWTRNSVIAKLCTRSYGTTDVERWIHRDVLPSAGLASVDIYGQVAEASGQSFWLFMEDLGDAELSIDDPDNRRLFARWLATLHHWDVRASSNGDLPDRGPAGYRQHLRSARDLIGGHLDEPWVSEQVRPVLARLLGLLEQLEGVWGRVEEVCAVAPRTLVHGDLVAKNIRARNTSGRQELVVLDWEMAGRGVPSIDLKLLGDDLEHYAACIRRAWPDMSLARVRALADVGRIFRSLVVLDWRAGDLAHPWCSTEGFDAFQSRLETDLRRMQSEWWT
jgi:hypothetical protein